MFTIKEIVLCVVLIFMIIAGIWWGVTREQYKWGMVKENNKMLHELVDTNRRLHEDDALYD